MYNKRMHNVHKLQYRLYTRYTFYCCSSRELFSFSQLEVRLFKACLIVWQMPHSFTSFWAQEYILLFLSAFHLSLTSLPLPLPHNIHTSQWLTQSRSPPCLVGHSDISFKDPYDQQQPNGYLSFFLSDAPDSDSHLKTLQLLANFHFLVVPQPNLWCL